MYICKRYLIPKIMTIPYSQLKYVCISSVIRFPDSVERHFKRFVNLEIQVV